jgi:hypothetical protein
MQEKMLIPHYPVGKEKDKEKGTQRVPFSKSHPNANR